MIANAFAGVGRLAARLRADRRGNVAMMFGLSLPVLIMMVFGGIDIHRVATVKANLQDALDAATLAAARSPYNTNAQLTEVGLASLNANLRANPAIDFTLTDASFTVTPGQVVIGSAQVEVKTLVANIVLPPYGKLLDDTLPVDSGAQVNRSSRNLEVALVLDITGSMNNGKINSLKTAANQLVDIVVQDLQTPYYSKMSLVPYSMGVNLDTYANGARGAAVSATNVSSIAWHNGVTRRISAATRANTIQITTTENHGFSNGDEVAIWNAQGMTELNGVAFTVTNASGKTFRLSGVDSRYWDSLSNSSSNRAYVAKCLRSDCKPKITANAHRLTRTVVFENVGGMSYLNQRPFTIREVNTNDFIVDVVGESTYSSGGQTFCGEYSCGWRVFESDAGSLRALKNTTCVSERTGSSAYTDTGPGSAKVSFNYASGSNGCPEAALRPLSSNKQAIKNAISALEIGGSTAGHIGAAWGWYTVSPNFNSLWPSSGAGAFGNQNLLKAVILMTDGEFNTPYASGVIAANAGSGSGSASDHINQNATNGSSFSQAERLCAAMRQQNILVYTVGFQVPASGSAAEIMRNCATSPEYAYLPASGADLTEAFKAIGRDITRLRISR